MFRVNVQNVDKLYKIYEKPQHRLWETLTRQARHKPISVLKNISFQVNIGKSLGLIGDNGAGKSTLLKLLAGTLSPTNGEIEVNGRVAALLELGAGFHPEFTGRQNIYLNASLLGISSEEIKEKESEIISFAELENFIDQPVKIYSSGMYVRLAFSIATMVNPEILIIDEALAVGDLAFQRKCIRRMNYFKEHGKTMLFCSHSMYHIQELCDKVIWLENGIIKKMGNCNEVVRQYENACNSKKEVVENINTFKAGKKNIQKECRIISLNIKSAEGEPIEMISDNRMKVLFEMKVEIIEDRVFPNFGFAVQNSEEELVAASLTHYKGLFLGPYYKDQIVVVRYLLEYLPLRLDSFILMGGVSDETGLLWYETKQLGPIPFAPGKGVGMLNFKGDWELL